MGISQIGNCIFLQNFNYQKKKGRKFKQETKEFQTKIVVNVSPVKSRVTM